MHRSMEGPLPSQYGVVPAPRIGILGGGQLAKMTALAAAEIGYEVLILERQDDFPANSLDTHALIGDWNDSSWVLKLASLVDVVTLENEFIELDALRSLTENGHRLWPSVETVGLVQDKVRQKQAFAAAGIPVATVAIGNGRNAGLLAVRMLAMDDAVLRRKCRAYMARLSAESRAKHRQLVRETTR